MTAEKLMIEVLVEKYYVSVSRLDSQQVSGLAEVVRCSEGHIQALVVWTTGRTPNETVPVYVPWHAVTAVTPVNERGGDS